MQVIKDKTLWFILGVTIVIRLPLFFPTVIDHDESTYLVIANELLKGKVLYEDLIDLKPPGVFWFFAAIQWVFGKSILLVRFIDALLIGGSAYLLFRMQKRFGGADSQGWFAALIFISGTTFHHFSLSFNNEHLMVFLTLVGFSFLLKKDNYLNAFLCGLWVGLGFIVKYLVLFDITALGLFFLVMTWQKTGSFQEVLKWAFMKGGLMLLGFLVVPILTFLYFYWGEHYDAFHFITFVAPGNYAEKVGWLARLRYFVDFNVAYLIYLPFFYWMLFKKGGDNNFKALKLLGWIWFFFTLLAVQATGKMFPHYYLQILPVVALLAGSSIKYISFFKRIEKVKWAGLKGFQLAIGVFMLVGMGLNFFEVTLKTDYAKKIFNWLEPRLKEGALFYPANTSQILYYLTDQSPLTPYVHATLMIQEGHVRTLEIDVDYWIDSIKQKSPLYVVVENEYEIESFRQYLDSNYEVVKSFDDRFHIWQRIR